MPPKDVTSPKRKRRYEHIKESELERGVSQKQLNVLQQQQPIRLDVRKVKPKANALALVSHDNLY